jgi:hypothetical protein
MCSAIAKHFYLDISTGHLFPRCLKHRMVLNNNKYMIELASKEEAVVALTMNA